MHKASEAARIERALSDAYWQLLVMLRAKNLTFPIAISPERHSDHGPRLCVQVDRDSFRDYFEQLASPVIRSTRFEHEVHVHVTGICYALPLHVVAVLDVLPKWVDQ